ncbi:uncharacterized protein HGUI_03545 [Hanseniaspora guilliermondii]|uniref:Uncharacterized protein n=1 Tax=Hanseniaspora guilliermondii TaxID=56406 RepID=A0A1L0B487_9ASCO|nr:uncharacterized protein HGUI_03545 [Hanseniaspora guilliermondii]
MNDSSLNTVNSMSLNLNDDYLDKKRKKMEISRNNTPSPKEIKKMKFGRLVQAEEDASLQKFIDLNTLPTIKFQDAYKLYLQNLNIELPESDKLFPWLHEYEKNDQDLNLDDLLEFKQNHTMILKSCYLLHDDISGESYIENSGVLKGSINLKILFHQLEDGDSMDTLIKTLTEEINFYNREMFQLGLPKNFIQDGDVIESIFDACKVNNILPILKTKQLNPNSLSYYNSASKHIDPGSYRKFDFQCCKMLLLSSRALIYCNHKDVLECSICKGARHLVNLVYHNTISKLKIFGDIADITRFKETFLKVSIVDEFVNKVDDKFVGIPLLPTDALRKPEHQLVSKFDTYIINNWEKDFLYRERLEMSRISSNTPMNDNLWIGNSIDFEVSHMGLVLRRSFDEANTFHQDNTICLLDKLNPSEVNDIHVFNYPQCLWDLFIHCKPFVGNNEEMFEDKVAIEAKLNDNEKIYFNFPASGTLGLGNLTLHLIKNIFQCIDYIHQITTRLKKRALIFAYDGYSESSFLILAYTIYSKQLNLKEAILYVHKELKRPFFVFPNDLEVLNYLQILLLSKAKERIMFEENTTQLIYERFEITNVDFTNMFFNTSIVPNIKSDLDCMMNLKGPLPSQILDYLYLGSLKHAESFNLLKDMDITCVVSVGERLTILEGKEPESCKVEKGNNRKVVIYKIDGITIYHIDKLLDNGHDPLLESLYEILGFIESFRKSNNNAKILIHCMVGVSRSATVVIAEVMKELKISLVRAYLYVRVRRLNIIIQPTLLFMYELLKFEEKLHEISDVPIKGIQEDCKRSIDWVTLCSSIDELNEYYLNPTN